MDSPIRSLVSLDEYFYPGLKSVEIWVLKDSEFELAGIYRTPQTFASSALNATAIALSDIFPQTA